MSILLRPPEGAHHTFFSKTYRELHADTEDKPSAAHIDALLAELDKLPAPSGKKPKVA